jgi:Flp pilus assembly pilin Flp
MLERIKARLVELRQDERGMTVVEIVLLIALIILPIVIVLAVFGKEIKAYIGTMWTETKGKADELKNGGVTGGGGS